MSDRISILGVGVDQVNRAEALEQIKALSKTNQVKQIVTANPEMLVAAQHNDTFRDAMNQAALVVPDGIGLLPAASFVQSMAASKPFLIRLVAMKLLMLKLLLHGGFQPLTERVSGADLVSSLAEWACENRISIFLVGGRHNEAALAKQTLEQRYPGIAIESDAGSADIANETEAEFQSIKEKIATSGAKLIFVAFGHPKQELWISQRQAELPAGVYMGVGGTFSYLAGTKRRAHPIIQKLGLEWLWRLLIEPKRLKRILVATIIFPWLVVKKSKY